MGIYILSGAAYKSQKNPIDNIFSNNLQLFNFYNFSTLTNNVATYDFHSAKKKFGEIKKNSVIWTILFPSVTEDRT